MSDSFGSPVCVPVMLAKGAEPGGTVVGLTAALHGNESSGIPTIQKAAGSHRPATLHRHAP